MSDSVIFREDEFEDWVYVNFDEFVKPSLDTVELFRIEYGLDERTHLKDLNYYLQHLIITELLKLKRLPILFYSCETGGIARSISNLIPLILVESKLSDFEPCVVSRMEHRKRIPKTRKNLKQLSNKLKSSKLEALSKMVLDNFDIASSLNKYNQ